MMISRSTIDKVFEVARVEEVIADFVQLRRSGANYKGLSPFSSERTPSFMVSSVKQIWKDFSSGKGGNVVSFLMEHEHFSYPEAIRYLANKYNIEIEEEFSQEKNEDHKLRESMYLVSEYAQQYFQQALTQTEQGKAIALPYFKERGFQISTIEKFKLGYSPDMWSAFTDDALSKGYKLEFLEKTGLTIVKENKNIDRFKGRVMFPIHSLSGRVLGFGARIMSSDKNTAKYLNSPESEIYHKSKILYGIYFAKQSIAHNDNCYLVEGYTDVIQMHQLGIENVISSSGTALTPDQILLIRRFTPNVTLLYDSDPAGLKAALRGVDLILEQGMNVRICTFPDGEDPDSFARKKSKDEIEQYLRENTRDFIQFKASFLMSESEGDPIVRAEVIRDMVRSISKVKDSIQRELYIKECSRIMEVSEFVLINSIAQIEASELKEVKSRKKTFAIRAVSQKKEDFNSLRIQRIERELLEILILYGNRKVEFEEEVLQEDGFQKVQTQQMFVFDKLFLELQDDELQMLNDDFVQMIKDIMYRYQVGDFSLPSLLKDIDHKYVELISSIVMEDDKRRLHDWLKRDIVAKDKGYDTSEMVISCVLDLRICCVDEIILKIEQKISSCKEDFEKQELIFEIIRYNDLKKRLAKRLRRVTY